MPCERSRVNSIELDFHADYRKSILSPQTNDRKGLPLIDDCTDEFDKDIHTWMHRSVDEVLQAGIGSTCDRDRIRSNRMRKARSSSYSLLFWPTRNIRVAPSQGFFIRRVLCTHRLKASHLIAVSFKRLDRCHAFWIMHRWEMRIILSSSFCQRSLTMSKTIWFECWSIHEIHQNIAITVEKSQIDERDRYHPRPTPSRYCRELSALSEFAFTCLTGFYPSCDLFKVRSWKTKKRRSLWNGLVARLFVYSGIPFKVRSYVRRKHTAR